MVDKWDYAEDVADAKEMIAEAGQVGKIVRSGSVTGDRWDPEYSASGETECTFVELEYTTEEIDNSSVKIGDKKLLMSVEGVDPAPDTSCQVEVGDVPYQVIKVTPLSPGGVVIMWTVQVRA